MISKVKVIHTNNEISMKNKAYTNGITLVALVITIIVLLILAGITISLTVGQNGIISRAMEAGSNMQIAQSLEEEDLKKFQQTMEDLMDNEMLIYTKEDLEKFRDDVNRGYTYEGKSVKLMADIDLQGNENNQWIPIQNFAGTFNGNNHCIKNMYIDSDKLWNCTFIVKLEKSGVIKELKLDNIYINQRKNSGSNASGLVGISEGIVESCSVSGIIGVYNDYFDKFVGGIVKESTGEISNCYSNVEIRGNKGYFYCGGIVGTAYNAKIGNCYTLGDMNLTNKNGSIGGIVGVAYGNTIIENCYNIGVISEAEVKSDTEISSLQAGIVGSTGNSWTARSNVTINNCYYLETSATYSVCDYNYDKKIYERRAENKVTSDELKGLYEGLGDAYIKDSSKINQGYPILKWQDEI